MEVISKVLGLLRSTFAEDKLKHIVLSAVIMVLLSLFLHKLVAAIVTLAIGIGKELYDKYTGKGCAEWKDLLSNAIGIVIGLL